MPRGAADRRDGWLRFGHANHRPRTRGAERRGQIPDMVSIHDRLSEVDERLVPRHWEGDLIKCKGHCTSVGMIVERTTLFTVLAKIESATAASAINRLSHVLNRIEGQKRLSLTYDQRREVARHAESTINTEVKVNFADAHSLWQRGINENINGLLGQYLPKVGDLSVFSQEDLDAFAWKLNTRQGK